MADSSLESPRAIFPRCRVNATDMSPMMQDFVELTTLFAKDNIVDLKEVAAYIREQFSKEYGGAWQCIVGYQFTTDVTPATDSYIFFHADDLAVLLWKVP